MRVLSSVPKCKKAVQVFPSEKMHIKATVWLAVGSILRNQQYILNKVFLNRNNIQY